MSAKTEVDFSGRVEIDSPQKYFEYCLSLRNRFENPPEVKLELYSQAPSGKPSVGAVDIAATTAIQCYAPGIASMKPREDEKSLAITTSTLNAGHNTTRLHAHYTWKLIGVSRSVTHDIFHSTPFYNSEQQSQRYVEAKMGNFLVPADLDKRQRELFVESANYANKAYFEMLELLRSEVERRLRVMYPKGGRIAEERLQRKIPKICQEVARYVLPIGQLTVFDHTLSELQLLRLFQASRLPNFSDEARYVVASMVNEVVKVDPAILTELRKPLEQNETIGLKEQYITSQREEFDTLLGDRQSKLLLFDERSRQVLAFAARNILGISRGQISEAEVLSLLFDPQKNRLLADVNETGMFDSLTSCLRQISMTFATRLSHTADSQRQRHRRTPGATPVLGESTLLALSKSGPDFFTPMIVRENDMLRGKYEEKMSEIYRNVLRCFESGIPVEDSLLLFPNGQSIRVVEQGDGFDWLHRWKQRLCYNAQEEIFFVSVEQVEQFLPFLSEAGKIVLAPCGIRQSAGIKPRCPEGGDRWCGKPVFNFDISEYANHRLV